jgi:hypothetical protein
MKKCSKCKLEKSLTDFNKHKSGKLGVHHYCKFCHSQQRKDTYDYNKSRIKQILYKYNLSEEDIQIMFKNQNGKCKICNIQYDNVSKHNALYIDHCHKTTKIRGLLCSKCNRLLGICNDNINILKSAINYLEL